MQITFDTEKESTASLEQIRSIIDQVIAKRGGSSAPVSNQQDIFSQPTQSTEGGMFGMFNAGGDSSSQSTASFSMDTSNDVSDDDDEDHPGIQTY